MTRARFFYFLCPACDRILQAQRPEPGDVGQCSACGAILEFSPSLSVRALPFQLLPDQIEGGVSEQT